MIKRYSILIFLPIVFLASCRKYFGPADNTTSQQLYHNNEQATAAMLAVYAQMETDGIAYRLMIAAGISSDELNNHRVNPAAMAMAENRLTPTNELAAELWTMLYRYVLQCNTILECLPRSANVTQPVRQWLTGEALFTRAWCHFYLGGLFGNVPYIISTDPAINLQTLQRSLPDILALSATDLQMAKQYLSTHYLDADNTRSSARIRPNKYAAHALLARLYLYNSAWQHAELEADTVIAAAHTFALEGIDKVFLYNNREAIWQLQPVIPGFNSYAGGHLQPSENFNTVTLTHHLLQQFINGDLRKINWIKFFPAAPATGCLYKFRAGQQSSLPAEATLLLRLGELHLIRAEAKAKQFKIPGALDDLNSIRARAGLPALIVPDTEALLHAIGTERQLELFGESGDRWLDLKRTGKINFVMPVVKGNSWDDTDQLFPVPVAEIKRNPRMVQNPGY